MSGLVIDASVTMSWILDDEGTPAALEARRRVARMGAVVPPLWRSEVANALLMASRRGRITDEEITESMRDLERFDIQADTEAWQRCWDTTLPLATAARLTVYDASYLELALRRQLPLATLDLALRAAALTSGVEVL